MSMSQSPIDEIRIKEAPSKNSGAVNLPTEKGAFLESWDSHYGIGVMHQSAGIACQDYVLEGVIKGNKWVAISDGCSGSKHSDVGARLLLWSLKVAKEKSHEATLKERVEHTMKTSPIVMHTAAWAPIQKGPDNLNPQKPDTAWVMEGLERYQKAIEGLGENQNETHPSLDFLSTALVLTENKNQLEVLMLGDGVLMGSLDEGVKFILSVQWDDNMPYYPGYQLIKDPSIETIFSKKAGAKVVVQWYRGEDLIDQKQGSYSYEEAKNGFWGLFPKEALQSLLIASDGLLQIKGVSNQEVLQEVLGFKNFQGTFIKRRILRALSGLAKKGSVPRDDWALGGFCKHLP